MYLLNIPGLAMVIIYIIIIIITVGSLLTHVILYKVYYIEIMHEKQYQ